MSKGAALGQTRAMPQNEATKLQRREPLDRKEKNVWITLPNP